MKISYICYREKAQDRFHCNRINPCRLFSTRRLHNAGNYTVKVKVNIKDILDMERGWSEPHLFLEWLRYLN